MTRSLVWLELRIRRGKSQKSLEEDGGAGEWEALNAELSSLDII